MKIYHNKLVRDCIPELIRQDGKTPITRTLTDDEFKVYLEKKLDEEVKEFHESGKVEELGDILEVIYAIAEANGWTDTVDLERYYKFIMRGGFSKRTLLIAVEDPEAE